MLEPLLLSNLISCRHDEGQANDMQNRLNFWASAASGEVQIVVGKHLEN